MSGLAPFFITGVNAKIKVNDKTMAFAQDFSYSIIVKHIAPKVLGRYESDSIEPVSYEVTGSFSVIRYASGAASTLRNTQVSGTFRKALDSAQSVEVVDENGKTKVIQPGDLPPSVLSVAGTSNLNAPHGVSDEGNGIGSWGQGLSKFFTDGRANEALNPASFKLSTFFNIEVWQKIAGGQCGVAKIRDCRIERADFTIAGKTSPALQRFTFRAIYVDEDSFLADFSGSSPAGSPGNQVRF